MMTTHSLLLLLLLLLVLLLDTFHHHAALAVSATSGTRAINNKDVTQPGFAALDLEEELRTCRRDLVLAASELPVQRRLQNELTACRRERAAEASDFETKKANSLAFWETRFAELSAGLKRAHEEELERVRAEEERVREELKEMHLKEVEALATSSVERLTACEVQTTQLREAGVQVVAEGKASLQQCRNAQQQMAATLERQAEEAQAACRNRTERLAGRLEEANGKALELTTRLETVERDLSETKEQLERLSYEKELLLRRLEAHSTDARVVFEAAAMKTARYFDNLADFINANVVVEIQRRVRAAYLAVMEYDYRAAAKRFRFAVESCARWLKAQADSVLHAVLTYDYVGKWTSLVAQFDSLANDASKRGKATAKTVYGEMDTYVFTPVSKGVYEAWTAFMRFYIRFRAATLHFLVSNPNVPPAVKANVEPIVNYTFSAVFAFSIFLVWLKLQQAFLWLLKTLFCSRRWFGVRRAGREASSSAGVPGGVERDSGEATLPPPHHHHNNARRSGGSDLGQGGEKNSTKRVTITAEEPVVERVTTPARESPAQVNPLVSEEEKGSERAEEGEEEEEEEPEEEKDPKTVVKDAARSLSSQDDLEEQIGQDKSKETGAGVSAPPDLEIERATTSARPTTRSSSSSTRNKNARNNKNT